MDFTDADVVEAIRRRKSTRNYLPTPVRTADLDAVRSWLDDPDRMRGPLGGSFRVELLADLGLGDRKIGTYGYTRGYQGILVGIAPPDARSLFELAYVTHGVVLLMTHLGLGTVWMGGSFSRADVLKSVGVDAPEIIAAIVPFGRSAGKKLLKEHLMKAIIAPANRKPMDEVFCFGDLETPLGEEGGPYRAALDLARRAPSAKNKQPWRVVVSRDQRRLHLFASFSLRGEVGTGWRQYACPPEYLDLGTFYRSLESALSVDGLSGSLSVEEPDISIPVGAEIEYLATWVRG